MQMVDQNHLSIDGLWAVQKEWIFLHSAVRLCVRVSPPPPAPLPLSLPDRQRHQLLPLCCQSGPPSAVLHSEKIYNSCMQCPCLKETVSCHMEDFHTGFNFAPLNWKGTFLKNLNYFTQFLWLLSPAKFWPPNTSVFKSQSVVTVL